MPITCRHAPRIAGRLVGCDKAPLQIPDTDRETGPKLACRCLYGRDDRNDTVGFRLEAVAKFSRHGDGEAAHDCCIGAKFPQQVLQCRSKAVRILPEGKRTGNRAPVTGRTFEGSPTDIQTNNNRLAQRRTASKPKGRSSIRMVPVIRWRSLVHRYPSKSCSVLGSVTRNSM